MYIYISWMVLFIFSWRPGFLSGIISPLPGTSFSISSKAVHLGINSLSVYLSEWHIFYLIFQEYRFLGCFFSFLEHFNICFLHFLLDVIVSDVESAIILIANPQYIVCFLPSGWFYDFLFIFLTAACYHISSCGFLCIFPARDSLYLGL